MHLVVAARSPGKRGFNLKCAFGVCGPEPRERFSISRACDCGPEPREEALILHLHPVVVVRKPGRDFDFKVQFVVVVRSPGKRLQSSGASCGRGPRGFDFKCASCGRGSEPRAGALISNVHLVVVSLSLRKGALILIVHLGHGGPEPREGASILHVHLAVEVRSPWKLA